MVKLVYWTDRGSARRETNLFEEKSYLNFLPQYDQEHSDPS